MKLPNEFFCLQCIFTNKMFVLINGGISYCMVCVSAWEDNPPVLVSGLSPVQMHKPYTNFLIAPEYICNLCIASYSVYNNGISIKD